MDIISFVFSGFWTFCGSMIILSILCGALVGVLNAFANIIRAIK